MSDLALMVTLELTFGGVVLLLIWLLLRSAEVTREDQQMSGEWMRRHR